MATESLPTGFGPGDVVVVGDRPDAQRIAVDVGVAVLVTSNGTAPPDDVLDAARARGAAVIRSNLDSYVSGRMITLSSPCHVLMDREPLTVRPDDLLGDITDEVKDVDYRAAVALDAARRPVGLVTRSDLVDPVPRRVLLVDHAEQAQSVPGSSRRRSSRSSTTTTSARSRRASRCGRRSIPSARRRRSWSSASARTGMEPSRPAATLLLGAVLSDTVILNSPTTTERDHAVLDYLERVLALDATAFGREMFEATSDLSRVPAEEIVSRDAKEYEAGGGILAIAQVETVGQRLKERAPELVAELEALRERNGATWSPR